jgi:hypothetical protein
MSIQVWHQPESGRIISKLQAGQMGNVERRWESTFPALPAYRRIGVSACRRVGVSASRKGHTKVARYEVPGHNAKRDVRPARDDRNGRLLVSRARLSDYQHLSIVPFLLRRPDFRLRRFVRSVSSKVEATSDKMADRPGRIVL